MSNGLSGEQVTAKDLIQDTAWFGEEDNASRTMDNLKSLNVLVSDLIQQIHWQYIHAKHIAESEGNRNAKEISDKAKSILVRVVKSATDEEYWDIVDKLFDKEKTDESFPVQ